MTFRHGAFEKLEPSKTEVRKYEDEDDYWNNSIRVGVSIRDGIVQAMWYLCRRSESDYTRVNGIACNDSGDEIIEKFGKGVRVLCEKQPSDSAVQSRVFDVVQYGTRYRLMKNRVRSTLIFIQHGS